MKNFENGQMVRALALSAHKLDEAYEWYSWVCEMLYGGRVEQAGNEMSAKFMDAISGAYDKIWYLSGQLMIQDMTQPTKLTREVETNAKAIMEKTWREDIEKAKMEREMDEASEMPKGIED